MSRVIHCRRQRLRVTPLWPVPNGSLRAQHHVLGLHIVPFLDPTGGGHDVGRAAILSARLPAEGRSRPASRSAFADTIGLHTDPHRRFHVIAAPPPPMRTACPPVAATRDRYISLGSVLMTWPNTNGADLLRATPRAADRGIGHMRAQFAIGGVFAKTRRKGADGGRVPPDRITMSVMSVSLDTCRQMCQACAAV